MIMIIALNTLLMNEIRQYKKMEKKKYNII